ncbi:MAG: YggS family pyridoxal phosphate-dependent enzyme [Bacteroidota bacterium]
MVSANIRKILEEIPPHVKLVAVSKTKPVELIQEAYETGQRAFGENKVQEMVGKYEQLPKDIEWHLIGHLQSNKVKYIAPFVHLIHAVDSLKLLEVINREAAKNNRVIKCLLQFHIAQEETKFGLDMDEARALLNSDSFKSMENVSIEGVMGMASFTEEEAQIRKEFRVLKSFFEEIKSEIRNSKSEISVLSFGMSGDYKIAIEEGSNMIRVGSSIFGGR